MDIYFWVYTNTNINHLSLTYNNGYIITWILHQNIMFTNNVKLAAGYNNIPPFHLLSYPIPSNFRNELNNKCVPLLIISYINT